MTLLGDLYKKRTEIERSLKDARMTYVRRNQLKGQLETVNYAIDLVVQYQDDPNYILYGDRGPNV